MAHVMATSNSNDQVTIIWLDSEVNNEENLATQQKLFQQFNHVEIVDDENNCQQMIRAKPKRPVFLVVSGRLSRTIVPAIDALGQVMAIFIYCMDESKHIEWAKRFPKIKGIVTALDKLIAQIQTNLKALKKKKPTTDPVDEVTHTLKATAISPPVHNNHHPNPLNGYEKAPLGSLEDAVAPLVDLVDDIKQMVWTVKQNATDPADGLTSDESASIALLTIDWYPKEKSISFILNEILRSEDRGRIKVWFRYLKLIFKALSKLPSITKIIYHGSKEEPTHDYSKSDVFTSWEFMSCTDTIESLENEDKFGKTGRRTLLTIQSQSGKDIRQHAYDSSRDQILLLPGRQLQMISSVNPGHDLRIIQIKELEPLFSFQ